MIGNLRKVVGVLAALTLTLGALTACTADSAEPELDPEPQPNGIADMKPKKAFRLAKKAMKGLDFKFKGTADTAEYGRATLTMVSDADGDCQVRMKSRSTGKLEIRVVEADGAYLRGNEAGLRNAGFQAADARQLANTWLYTGGAIPDGLPLCASNLLAGFTPARKGASDEIQGDGVQDIVGNSLGYRVVLSVATQGDPLVLRIVSRPIGSPPETLDLVDHGSGRDIKRPPKLKTIDLGGSAPADPLV